MIERDELLSNLIQLNDNPRKFEELALEIFHYQYRNNPVYQQYLDYLGVKTQNVSRIQKIPFLPIEFFKSKSIITGNKNPKLFFESSGTTSFQTSTHYVSDLALYETLSRRTFEQMYGALTNYHIFALLPSYLERNTSSLVYMVNNFINHNYSSHSGFFLDNTQEMIQKINLAAQDNRKILLIGVSFALLDLAENQTLSNQLKQHADKLVIMETGGMKGRRKEMIREELHEVLKIAFGVNGIHSEYGMTELFSQAYSKGNGYFDLPPVMKVLLREINDPFSYLPNQSIGAKTHNHRQRTGGINVIDLANIDSCSFIETKDLGIYSEDYKQFKVIGRFDDSDIRGCNLLVS